MGLQDSFPAYGGQGPLCVRTGLSLAAAATLLMVLRLYVRLRINKIGTTALVWALAAWILTMVTQILGVLAALHGLGNHIEVVLEKGEGQNFLKFAWLTMFFFLIAIATGKAAVAMFLMEINGQVYPRVQQALIALSILNFAVAIPVAIYSQLQCNPISALWDPLLETTHCNSSVNTKLSYLAGATAAFSDLVLALLPISILWNLRIDRKLKIGMCCLLGVGIFAAAAAVVRTWACQFIASADPSYHLATLFVWGEVEEWVVIILMSIPPTWPLFKPFCQRFLTAATNISRSDKSWAKASHSRTVDSEQNEVELWQRQEYVNIGKQ